MPYESVVLKKENWQCGEEFTEYFIIPVKRYGDHKQTFYELWDCCIFWKICRSDAEHTRCFLNPVNKCKQIFCINKSMQGVS